MNKRNFTTVQLSQGEMHIYDLGGVRLHACQTGDPLADEVFLLEKAGQFVVLEPPCFTDSIAALGEYLEDKIIPSAWPAPATMEWQSWPSMWV